MSQDLAQWLLEQVAEDERIALEVLDGGGLVDPQSYGWQADSAGFGDPDYGALIMCMKFAARWRPRAVLAECEAKRKIVAEAVRTHKPSGAYGWDEGYSEGAWEMAQTALRLLALPFADRPGYRECEECGGTPS